MVNALWRFAERMGAKLVALIVEIVIARELNPEDYGTIALITVFTSILQVFVDSGLGSALIQKKDADDLDFSTVFYVNVSFCLVLYALMFFCAPLIASFYNDPELTPLIRVLSLTLVISGVKNVQHAYVSRNMLFKRFFFATLGGTIGAAVVGIVMAYSGFGVWALIAQMLFNTLVDTIILWITVKWRPKKMFSFKRLKVLFSFGWKLLVSALLETVYTEIRQLIIGKKYTKEDLSFYNQGNKYPYLLVSNINVSIDSVLLPSMSNVQDDVKQLKSMTRRAIKTSSYLLMPLMCGFAVCADSIISILLKDKWLPCVPFLRIFCITYAFYPIHTSNLNALKAMGRSDLFLVLEILKKAVGIISIIVALLYGVMAMAYSMLFTSFMSQLINSWPNKKLMNYGYLEQIKDMLPNILLSLFMGACVYCITFFNLGNIITLIIQVLLGVLIYVAGSIIFHIDSFEYCFTMMKGLLKRRGNKKTN